MRNKKRILLKLTGEIFIDPRNKNLTATLITDLITQIKELMPTHQFCIVSGGGNLFRGSDHGTRLGITPSVGHQIGMLATMMNGLIIKDLLEKQGIATSLFCAIPSPEIGKPISQQAIMSALAEQHTLVFTGGTGNPFFTTDTTAILRALQISADEIWKGTNVDGIYTTDPHKDRSAQLLKKVTYAQALQQQLGIMDATAFALAGQYHQTVRIFNIFSSQALLHAAREKDFGSIIA